jgi:hypothetical protein
MRGVDKQFAALRAQAAVIVTEVPFNRRHDASIHDAGEKTGCHICGVYGIEVEANFWHTLQQSRGAEKCPIGGQSCHVLQPICVADAVVRVDCEPDAANNHRRHVHRSNCGEARHILNWRTESCFIATE